MQAKIQLIIAKYKEALGWLGRLPFPALVYDKSSAPLPGAIPLPNIGREGHSFLEHIVRNYRQLAEVNAFLQGAPFQHIEGGPEGLTASILDFSARGAQFKGLAWFTLKCDHLGRPHDMREEKARRWAGFGKDIPVGRLHSQLFDGPVPLKYHAKAATGQFLVTRERIQTRPWGFYRQALDILEADPQDAENTGHALERLWSVVFNGHLALNRNDYPPEPQQEI